MPELPEVETVAARLRGELEGARISSVPHLRDDFVKQGPRRLAPLLAGRTVESVRRHGKRILVPLLPGGTLNFHLGMTGNLLLVPVRAPVAAHTHLRVRFRGSRRELRFIDPRRFGGIWLDDGPLPVRGGRFSTDLGPDALRIRLPDFRELLSRRRQVKALLLDQTAIAGLGNIYTDEALFLARIHPRTPASELDDRQVRDLLHRIRTVLRAAIRARGSTLRDYVDADGEIGGYQARHRIYGREGLPCRRCGAEIERVLIASRSTHLCPRCQRR